MVNLIALDFGTNPVHGFITLIITLLVYVIWAFVSEDSLAKHIEKSKRHGEAPRGSNLANARTKRRRRLEKKYNLGYLALYAASTYEMDELERKLNKL